jgi:hypothetical protein
LPRQLIGLHDWMRTLQATASPFSPINNERRQL